MFCPPLNTHGEFSTEETSTQFGKKPKALQAGVSWHGDVSQVGDESKLIDGLRHDYAQFNKKPKDLQVGDLWHNYDIVVDQYTTHAWTGDEWVQANPPVNALDVESENSFEDETGNQANMDSGDVYKTNYSDTITIVSSTGLSGGGEITGVGLAYNVPVFIHYKPHGEYTARTDIDDDFTLNDAVLVLAAISEWIEKQDGDIATSFMAKSELSEGVERDMQYFAEKVSRSMRQLLAVSSSHFEKASVDEQDDNDNAYDRAMKVME